MIITDLARCTGCAACANACPHRAIRMQENAIGYYHPVINAEKCVECGLCEKICPEITKGTFGNNAQKCFAVQAKDDLRYISSSGGAFSLIVEECFRRYEGKDIYIAGAAFDDAWNIHHILINDLHDLDKLRRSKYVQSFISEDFYRNIRELLQKGAFVVFSGVPCQAAGLKSFLQKDYENLLIIDLLCAQICSPKIYRKFLEDNYSEETITSINFRSKIRGWDAHTVITTREHPEEVITPRFMQAYVSHLTMNEPCKKCQHHSLYRQGDISIGDFWGIGMRIPRLDDRKGTSCILTNTAKGEDIVQSFKTWCKLYEELPMGEALKSNWILQGDFPPHKDITLFHKNIDRFGYNKCLEQSLQHKWDVAVMGWFWVPNRGAILTNYALNEAINSLGYNCRTIDFIPGPGRKDEYIGHISEQFAKNYLRLTKRVNDYAELVSLNAEFGTFVVGSDQLWRYEFRKWPRGHLFLNFVNSKNKKLSYATSFGVVPYDGTDTWRRLNALWLSRFDAISVRETDAVNILKKDFNIEGVQVLDPVFLLDKSDYEKIAMNSLKKDGDDVVAYYFLIQTDAKIHIVRSAEAHYNTIAIDIKKDLPIEDWLYYIKNCRILITDSFHGSCFAAIFNKNFITTNIVNETPSRFISLFSITGMMDHFLFDASEFDRKRDKLFQDIDWTEANANLQKEIRRSRDWLRDALEKPRRAPSNNVELLNSILADAQEKSLELGIRCWRIENEQKRISKANIGEHIESPELAIASQIEEIQKKETDLQIQISSLQSQQKETMEAFARKLNVHMEELSKKEDALSTKIEEYNRDLSLLSHKGSILFNYYRYRIGKNFIFKRRYAEKSRKYKEMVQRIRKLQSKYH